MIILYIIVLFTGLFNLFLLAPNSKKLVSAGLVKETLILLIYWLSEFDCGILCAAEHNSSSLCPQGFPGDFGERGPPGPDGEPVCHTPSYSHTIMHLNTYPARMLTHKHTSLPHANTQTESCGFTHSHTYTHSPGVLVL